MDMYYNPAWRREHHQVAALFDLICPTDNPRDWKVFYRWDTTSHQWQLLTRGTMGNPDGFILVWGPTVESVNTFLINHDSDFVTHWQLTKMVDELKEKGIDLLAIPFDTWKEQP